MNVEGYHHQMVEKYGSLAAAARALGIARTTLQGRIEQEQRAHYRTSTKTVFSETHAIDLPIIEESRPPVSEILERMSSDFERKKASTDAHEWFQVKVHDLKPFGLMVWGDPHIDNPGCDITLLRHHMSLAKHPAVFSLNIGDTLDGWVGRLARLYGESSIDLHNARELAMWFMREVRWLLWLAGNHDMWADNEAIFRLMSDQAAVKLLPWQAKFELVFPNGQAIKVHAAHDFPGRSMANIVHGHMRAARFTSPADLLLAGHLHDWGSSVFEMAGFGRTPLSIRVRGYKTIDSYAVTNGYQSARHGGSCLVIIDPNVEGPGRMMPFWNIEQGIDVLDILANRYKGDPSHEEPKNTPHERARARRAALMETPDAAPLRVRAPAAKPAGGKPAVRRARGSAGRKAAKGRPARSGAHAAAAGKRRRG